MNDEMGIVGTAHWGPPPHIDLSGGPMTWWELALARIGQVLEDFGFRLQSRATARVGAIEKAKFEAAYGPPFNHDVFISVSDGTKPSGQLPQ